MGGLVTYGEYRKYGFDLISREDFGKFRRRAEAVVHRYTFKRVDKDNITAAGKHAVCRIADIFFEDARDGRLTGFSNEGYQESYRQAPSDEAIKRAEELLYTFFDSSFTFRGVNKYRPEKRNTNPYSPEY